MRRVSRQVMDLNGAPDPSRAWGNVAGVQHSRFRLRALGLSDVCGAPAQSRGTAITTVIKGLSFRARAGWTGEHVAGARRRASRWPGRWLGARTRTIRRLPQPDFAWLSVIVAL